MFIFLHQSMQFVKKTIYTNLPKLTYLFNPNIVPKSKYMNQDKGIDIGICLDSW